MKAIKKTIITNGRVFTPVEFTEIVKKSEINSPKNVELLKKYLCNSELASEVEKFFEGEGTLFIQFKGAATFSWFED